MNDYLMDFKEGLRKCLLLILCVLGLKFFRKKLYRPPNKTETETETEIRNRQDNKQINF